MEFLLTFLHDCGPGKKEVRAGDAVNVEKLDTCRCNHRIPKKVGFSKLDRQSGTEGVVLWRKLCHLLHFIKNRFKILFYQSTNLNFFF